MQSRLNPYIGFNGNAREAMEFYHSVFGGKLDLRTFKDFHASQDKSQDDKIMHGMLEAAGGIVLMGADSGMESEPGTTISISLSGDNDAELSGYYEKLSAGGTIQEPLKVAPWGDKFGMFVDTFGIHWIGQHWKFYGVTAR